MLFQLQGNINPTGLICGCSLMLQGEFRAFDMSFGENLRRLRRDKGFTQGDVAEKMGIKTTHISTLEKDKGDPKLSTLYKLMDALACSPNTLLLDEGRLGVDGLLGACFDRAAQLPDDKKRVIIDVIDSYIRAQGIEAFFSKKGLAILERPTKSYAEIMKAQEGS